VNQISPAQLTDLTVGSCVAVVRQPAPAPGAPPAPAKSITISASSNGSCPENSSDKAFSGKVSSVNGQTVAVQTSPEAPTSITVDPATTYTKRTQVTALAITPGACLSAAGMLDPRGTLEAKTATINPLDTKGNCPGT